MTQPERPSVCEEFCVASQSSSGSRLRYVTTIKWQRTMVFSCCFSGELWKYGGESSWWFTSLPVEDAEDLERFCSHRKRNFGSIRVTAMVGDTSWQTSLFRDTKSNTYLLPVKANVRSKEKLAEKLLTRSPLRLSSTTLTSL